MKSTSRLTVAAIVLGLTLVASAQRGNPADTLLGAGLHQEEVEDNCKEAVKTYERVIRQSGAPRSTAARAQLHIGMCLERLGEIQAREAYEKVVTRYGDQTDTVALAKSRLGQIAAEASPMPSLAATGPTKVVAAGTNGGWGAVTLDGRYAVSASQVRDLVTGQSREIDLAHGGTCNFYPDDFKVALSPDSRQLAYACVDSDSPRIDAFELRVIPLNAPAGTVPQVLAKGDEVTHVMPFGWSPDGKDVLALLRRSDYNFEIASVSVDDGTQRVIKRLDRWQWPESISLSPDGRYIVFDRPVEPGSRNRDVIAISSDGRSETPLVQDFARDTLPVWTPDGRAVVFARDRSGALGLWMVRVLDGKPIGDASVLRANTGVLRPMGFSREGSFYYSHYVVQRQGIQTTDIDLASAAIVRPAARLDSRLAAWNSSPAYSPDGTSLAYLSKLPALSPFVTIVIRSLATGGEREIHTSLVAAGSVDWFPDQKSIAVIGRASDGEPFSVRRIELETGKEMIQRLVPTFGLELPLRVSPDGARIFFVRRLTRAEDAVIAYDLENQRETRLLLAPSDEFADVVVSPDGRQIAVSRIDLRSRAKRIDVLPASGGESKALQVPGGFGFAKLVQWMPNGEDLLWFHSNQTLRLIPTNGGEPRSLGTGTLSGIAAIHPQGRQIATLGARQFEGPDVWIDPDLVRIGRDLLTVRLDAAGKAVPGSLIQLTHNLTGIDAQPLWSPDGKAVAFKRVLAGNVTRTRGSLLTVPLRSGPPMELVVRTLETGRERTYRMGTGDFTFGGLGWIRGDSLMLLAVGPKLLSYRLDVAAGQFKEVPELPNLPHQTTKDGSHTYTLVRDPATNQISVAALDLSTGQERRSVIRGFINRPYRANPPGGMSFVRLSPDGRRLAVVHRDGMTFRLSTFAPDGSGYRELTVTKQGVERTRFLTWSRDSRTIFFPDLAGLASSPESQRIMSITVSGGTPQFTGLILRDLTNDDTLDLSPDGTRLVFSGRAENVSIVAPSQRTR